MTNEEIARRLVEKEAKTGAAFRIWTLTSMFSCPLQQAFAVVLLLQSRGWLSEFHDEHLCYYWLRG